MKYSYMQKKSENLKTNHMWGKRVQKAGDWESFVHKFIVQKIAILICLKIKF